MTTNPDYPEGTILLHKTDGTTKVVSRPEYDASGSVQRSAHTIMRGPFVYTQGGQWVRAALIMRVAQGADHEGHTALYAANGAVWLSEEPIEVVLRALTLIADRYHSQ